MASSIMCGCGLMYRVGGSSGETRTKCPSCGRPLKGSSGRAPVPPPPTGISRPVAIGIGAGSALLAAAVTLAAVLALRPSSGGPKAPPAVASPRPAPPSEAVEPSTAAYESSSVGKLDRQMLPSGPIR